MLDATSLLLHINNQSILFTDAYQSPSQTMHNTVHTDYDERMNLIA